MFLPEYRVYESAALDRAEYSLQQGIIVIALVCGGLALGATGIVRLTNVGLRRMPRVVAAAASLTGAAVLFFGAAYARTALAPDDELQPRAMPQVSLEPTTDDADRPRDVVHGVVRTASGAPAPGVDVELIPLFSGEEAEERSTITDDDGAFVFTDVEVTPGTPYVADVQFAGTTFPSQVLRFGRGIDDPVRVIVAGSTRSARSLTVDVESIAIVGDETGLQAVHSVTVRNRGQRAYTGGLKLPLLPGANAIQPGPTLDRRHLSLEHGAIVSNAPVLPGRSDYTYTYIASMHREGVRIQHRPSHQTERFELLLGPQLTINAPTLRSGGEVTLGERTYSRYESQNLSPRTTSVYEVTAKRPSQVLRNLGLAFAAVVATAVVLFPLLRRRRRRPAPAPEHETVPIT